MNNTLKFKKILVTGGAGFIGSSFIRWGLQTFQTLEKIVNLDLLTYAASEKNMAAFREDPRHIFVKGDIQDTDLVESLSNEHQIEAIVHFAAESHVDRSITNPKSFIDTNISGTFSLLEVVRKNPHIHFHHISTDEVYGSLKRRLFYRILSLQTELTVRRFKSRLRSFSTCMGPHLQPLNHHLTLQQQLWTVPA